MYDVAGYISAWIEGKWIWEWGPTKIPSVVCARGDIPAISTLECFCFFFGLVVLKRKTRVYASVRAHVFRAAHRATATRSSESLPCIEGTPFPSAAYPFAWDLSFLSPPELRQQGIWVLLGATLFPAVALIVGCLCLFVHNNKDQQW